MFNGIRWFKKWQKKCKKERLKVLDEMLKNNLYLQSILRWRSKRRRGEWVRHKHISMNIGLRLDSPFAVWILTESTDFGEGIGRTEVRSLSLVQDEACYLGIRGESQVPTESQSSLDYWLWKDLQVHQQVCKLKLIHFSSTFIHKIQNF